MLKRKGIVAAHVIEKSFSTAVDIHKQGLMWVGKELSSWLPKDLSLCLTDFAAIVKCSQAPVKRNKVSVLLPGISAVVCTYHWLIEMKSITQQPMLAQMKDEFFFSMRQITETRKILMMKALGIRYIPEHRFLLTVTHSQFNPFFFL